MMEQQAYAIAVNPDGIPDYLKERPQWIVWRFEKRDGKYTKVPFSAWKNTRASSTDLLTWTTFEAAYTIYRTDERYRGVGFMFCSGDPFVGIDLDNCRDPLSGELESWAQDVLDKYPGAYAEVSPSGEGVHIIIRGKVPEGSRKRKGSVEIYDQGRYFAITGVAA
jgi:putative DNA primase/helicase